MKYLVIALMLIFAPAVANAQQDDKCVNPDQLISKLSDTAKTLKIEAPVVITGEKANKLANELTGTQGSSISHLVVYNVAEEEAVVVFAFVKGCFIGMMDFARDEFEAAVRATS